SGFASSLSQNKQQAQIPPKLPVAWRCAGAYFELLLIRSVALDNLTRVADVRVLPLRRHRGDHIVDRDEGEPFSDLNSPIPFMTELQDRPACMDHPNSPTAPQRHDRFVLQHVFHATESRS